jgi:peroxiredoxin
MKRYSSILAVTVLGLGVLMFPERAGASERIASGRQDLLGKRASDFDLEDVHGKQFSLKDFRGKVVVLDFWAVWCGPCQLSLPFFQTMADQYGPKGLEVVGLHVDDRRPSVEDIEDYLAARKVHYTNLMSTVEVDDAYQVYAMPTTYLLDRDGRIRKVHVGFNPATAPEEIEKEIRVLLENE